MKIKMRHCTFRKMEMDPFVQPDQSCAHVLNILESLGLLIVILAQRKVQVEIVEPLLECE